MVPLAAVLLLAAPEIPAPLGPEPVAREFRVDEVHQYLVSLEAGDACQVAARQLGVDVLLEVFDPSGASVLNVDLARPFAGDEVAFFVAGAAGAYRVEVRSAEELPDLAGRYEIRVAARRPADEADRRRAEALGLIARASQLRLQEKGEAMRAALPLVERALQHWRALGDRAAEADALNQMALVHARLGERDRAIEGYRQAVAIARETGSSLAEATYLNSLGVALAARGDSRAALEQLRRALELVRGTDAADPECAAGSSGGQVLLALGEPHEALRFFDVALDACRRTRSGQMAASVANGRGRLFRSLGLNARARTEYEQALALLRGAGAQVSAWIAKVLASLAALDRVEGRLAQAEARLQEALAEARAAEDPSTEAQVSASLGVVLGAAGRLEEAVTWHSQAIEKLERVGDRPALADALVARGQLHTRAGRLEQARIDLERGRSLSADVLYPHVEAAALHGLATLERAAGRPEESWGRQAEALRLAESLRARYLSQKSRAEYMATVRPYYEQGIEVLMELHRARPGLGWDARAFETAERGRAQSLLEDLATPRTAPAADPELAERERQVREQLSPRAARLWRLPSAQAATLRKEVEALLDELEQIDARKRAAAFPDTAGLSQPVSVAELQREAASSERRLLVYALGEHRSYAWLVSPEGTASHELPPRAAIEDLADRWHQALSARNERPRFETAARRRARVAEADRQAAELGRELSRALLEPVLPGLGPASSIVVVPDGALHRVPFAALPLPAAPGPAGPPQPMVAQYRIVHAPSAAAVRFWGRTPAAARRPKTLAVFADPVFDASDARVSRRGCEAEPAGLAATWRGELTRSLERSGVATAGGIPRLPETRREADVLAALVPPAQRHVALDFSASRAAALDARLGDYRYVHFATHGVLDESQPELSSIVLSLVDRQGGGQDGFLRAEDAARMRLHADMVALSGCRTGLGKELRGEGILGLTHGFLRAGARRVLVSLWDVDDRGTSELMAEVYRGMLGPQRLDPPAALRAAQRRAQRDVRWSSPYFWAGFVLVGDPGAAEGAPDRGRAARSARTR